MAIATPITLLPAVGSGRLRDPATQATLGGDIATLCATFDVIHQVIAQHLEGFLRAVAEAGDGAGLPQFSSSASSGSLCSAGCSKPAWHGFAARAASASIWCRSRVKAADGVRAAEAGG